VATVYDGVREVQARTKVLMVVVADMLHDNPEDEASVLAVLGEHPEVCMFIQQLSEQAQELFPGVRIQIDAVQWEPYDPPVRIVLHIRQRWDDYKQVILDFASWMGTQPEFDPNLVGVLPLWEDSNART